MSDDHADARIEKFKAAYLIAMRASHGLGAVRLLVSQEAWDWLMTMRIPKSQPGEGWPDWSVLGIPVTCDNSSRQPEGFSIIVETRELVL